MRFDFMRMVYGFTIALGLCGFCLGNAFAEGQSGIEGWEKDSAYNKLYNPAERDKLKGTVLGMKEIIPLPGMAKGVALELRDSDDDIVSVHIGPRSYVDPRKIGIKKGDKVRVKGAWVEIEGEDVFIASKVKMGEYFEYKVRRTRDGTPYWTMSPEQVEREKTGN